MRACVAASARSSALHLRLGGLERKRDGLAALERRERGDDGGRGGGAVELAAGHSLDDPDVEPLAHDLGVDALAIDPTRDLGELVAHGSVVGLHRGRDVDAEDPRPQPPEAAQRAKAAALGRGGRHGGAPVRLDAELGGIERERLAVGRERDRRALQRCRPRGEQANGLRLRHPADIDACDRGAGSELRLATRRTRAREPAGARQGPPRGRLSGAGQSGGGIGARAGGRSSYRCAPNRGL